MQLRLAGLVFLVCLALAAPLGASGGGEKPSEGAAAPSTGPLLPWKGEPVVYSGVGWYIGVEENPEAPIVKAYRARTGNVSIDWSLLTWEDYGIRLNTAFQAGDMPDVICDGNYVTDAGPQGAAGLLLDFTAYSQYMPNVRKWAETMPGYSDLLPPEAARYVVRGVATAEWLGEGWFYNPAILSAAGIAAPPDSLADMMQAMKKVKATVPDVDGYFSYWGMPYVLGVVAGAMDAKRDVQLDFATRKWVYGPTMDPRYRESLEYIAEMYRGGLLNPEIMSIAGERDQEVFNEGKYAFSFHYYGEQKIRWLDAGKPEPMKGMGPPKAPDGKRYYRISAPHEVWGQGAYLASAHVKRPELLAAYLDNAVSYETYELFEWGVEGLTYQHTADGGYEFLPAFLKAGTGEPDTEKLSALGLNTLLDCQSRFSDLRVLWFSKYYVTKGDVGREACAADIKRLANGDVSPRWWVTPPALGAEQSDEVAKIMTPVTTFVAEEELKFITGDRPFSEWSEFQAQINKLGDIAKAVGYYNAARQVPFAERVYPILPPDLR